MLQPELSYLYYLEVDRPWQRMSLIRAAANYEHTNYGFGTLSPCQLTIVGDG